MALIPYTKPHATTADMIRHLENRGLSIPSPRSAAQEIELIGYERLRIYFLSRRQIGVIGKPFNPGTSFEDIVRLYECDMALRDACFAAVGQFELLLRNSISETLSSRYGSHPYFECDAFKNAASQIDALKMFADIYNKSRDRRAKHYKENYSHPSLFPIWRMKEFMTFGATSRILQFLSGPLRTNIAADFGVPKDLIFTNWVECLVDLRNNCAHHDRLFNRKFQKQPSILLLLGASPPLAKPATQIPTSVKHSLKAILQCLDYMLKQRGVASDVTTKVGDILGRYPEAVPSEAGY
ncbi:Abi family protein [Agrobacterium sp. BA1120]|uniref:Abi family protein n=1 Tax=Agrobacterium sp. BA1120 TaxID=3228927 RepID=UPI003369E3E0